MILSRLLFVPVRSCFCLCVIFDLQLACDSAAFAPVIPMCTKHIVAQTGLELGLLYFTADCQIA